jgi:hypothetical protein
MFLDKVTRKELLGDLDEELPLIRSEYGEIGASMWYWNQVIHSCWAVIGPTIIKVVKAISAAAAASEIISKIHL